MQGAAEQLTTAVHAEMSMNHKPMSNALLQVSPDPLRRRIHQLRLQGYYHMTDVELDTITKEYVETHPNCGSRSYAGYLRSRGLRVRRYHVRESSFRVDSQAVCMRQV